MKWSFKVGEISGIALYIHFTFPLLLLWVLLARSSTGTLETAVNETVFILIVFGTVVLHELGHALAAQRYGIQTRDITLYPIGGVARLERMPEDPAQELVVALAGPAVNVAIAAGLFLWLGFTEGWRSLLTHLDLRLLASPDAEMLPRLLVVNVWLVLFNLLPAFPMDGGRVLRAVLALNVDYVQATQTAASIGQGMALLFGFWGLFVGHPLLIFIALFVWIGAGQEASMVQVRFALAGIPVSRVMIREFRTLGAEDSLAQATQHILAGFQQDFPVLEGGRLVGVLTRADLITALAEHGETGRVADAMRRDYQTADPADMLEGVLTRLQECECRSLPVVRNGQLLGLITMDNLGEFLMIRTALSQPRPPAAA